MVTSHFQRCTEGENLRRLISWRCHWLGDWPDVDLTLFRSFQYHCSLSPGSLDVGCGRRSVTTGQLRPSPVLVGPPPSWSVDVQDVTLRDHSSSSSAVVESLPECCRRYSRCLPLRRCRLVHRSLLAFRHLPICSFYLLRVCCIPDHINSLDNDPYHSAVIVTVLLFVDCLIFIL